jgi:hypothetical protein
MNPRFVRTASEESQELPLLPPSWPLVTCTTLELSPGASLNHLATSARLRFATTVPPVYINPFLYPGGLSTH